MKFTVENFKGSGQYLVRDKGKGHIQNTGYLTGITKKVCYSFGYKKANIGHSAYLIDMSDGLITKRFEEDWPCVGTAESKRKLVDWLNSEGGYRFATREELVRIAMFQGNRAT